MSKNNYYYNKESYYRQKLGQALLFTEVDWREVPDFNEPNDQIYTVQFLSSFQNLLARYSVKNCLEKDICARAFDILAHLRKEIPYNNAFQKQWICEKINEMIGMINLMEESGVDSFYLKELEKRYTYSRIWKGLTTYYYKMIWKDYKEIIREDLADDIYYLILLVRPMEELRSEEFSNLLLQEGFLGTINAVQVEYPELFKDLDIKERFLTIFSYNVQLSSILKGKREDRLFHKRNKMLMKKLSK